MLSSHVVSFVLAVCLVQTVVGHEDVSQPVPGRNLADASTQASTHASLVRTEAVTTALKPVVAHISSQGTVVHESHASATLAATKTDEGKSAKGIAAATALAETHEHAAKVVPAKSTTAHGIAPPTQEAARVQQVVPVGEMQDKKVHVHITSTGETETEEDDENGEEILHRALLQREQAEAEAGVGDMQHTTSGKGSRRREGGARQGQSQSPFGAVAMTMPQMARPQQSSCFPPHTEVKVMDMSTGREVVKAMRLVEVGDHVATVDGQGRHSWSPVQFFLHRDAEPTEYVELVWGTGSKAHVSPSHLVWRADGQHVAAGELKVGDKVFTHSRVGVEPNVELVTSTTLTSFGGRYHPVTGHETIVVDSLVASTHSTRTKPVDGSHRRAYAFTRMMLSGLYRIAPQPVSRWWNGQMVPRLVPIVDWVMA